MKGRKTTAALGGVVALLLLAAGAVWGAPNPVVPGVIDGVSGPDFTLTAGTAQISTPEGNSVFIWGFAEGTGGVQYPGPVLIVDQGRTVSVTLVNTLPEAVSIVFPGQAVSAEAVSGTTQMGLLTLEAAQGGAVRYRFTADRPGTYLYHSGTRPELQVEMGLFGALIVRPAGFDPAEPTAYGHPESAYDGEYLFLLSEIDPWIHRLVEQGRMDEVDSTAYFPTYWFINGRAAPDTMFEPYIHWLPAQPYNCMPMMYPGERLLFRVIGAGRDLHPLHPHGNHARVIARDGHLLASETAGPGELDLSYEVFTVQAVPGQTADVIFTWTGEGLGWDIYGHAADDPPAPHEYLPDHGKPFPVLMPELSDLTFGGFWSGSPFLGTLGALPPGEGGLNPTGGFVYMIHSHTEKEMTNNDIFPGGLMTMLVVMSPMMGEMDPMNALPLEPGMNPLQGGK